MTLASRLGVYGNRPAVVAGGREHTYRELDERSLRIAAALLGRSKDLAEARIAFLVPPGPDYLATLTGIFRAGGVAVPLAVSHPRAEIEHVVRDSGAETVVLSRDMRDRAEWCGGATVCDLDGLIARAPSVAPMPAIAATRRAMMVYTSGTTGRPKGVVTTHANIEAQTTALVEAWEWTRDDRTLLVLPLHHVHGIINVVACAMWTGAVCEMPPGFDVESTWDRLASGDITVFTAVPTIYHRLIASWDATDAVTRSRRSEGCRRVRLMMSGSAALPVPVLERWRDISGHVLLERYGMTEIGMALANPLRGPRHPGFVGVPLPRVDVRLVDDRGGPAAHGEAGELEVRGPAVFLEYWGHPEATRQAFRDGWFRTGDVAVFESGSYRLLGRRSTDILKSGGFKISALEIEATLREHPAIAECAVVGLDDPEWGQRVAAAVELRTGAMLTLSELDLWARDRLAPYKIPRALVCVEALPRNAMGKVVKPQVAALFAPKPPMA